MFFDNIKVSNKEAPGGAVTPQGPDHKELLVIESSLAQPTRTRTGETHTADEARYSCGVAIATNPAKLREIKKLSPGCYSVPASKPSAAYVVTVRPVEACSCEDSLQRNVRCKHRHAVLYMLRYSGACEGCGVRHFWRELTEVTEDHASLTYFEGDHLCPECLSGSDCFHEKVAFVKADVA